jgi:hypothetical protein
MLVCVSDWCSSLLGITLKIEYSEITKRGYQIVKRVYIPVTQTISLDTSLSAGITNMCRTYRP